MYHVLCFKTLYLQILNKNGNFYATIDNLKLLWGITKLNPSLNVCVIFDFRNITIACQLNKFYQDIQW